jgi:acyl carrier protein
MTQQEILTQLTTIMRKVFDTDDVTPTLQTVAKDIPEWDSLTHVELVVAVEKHFKFKFNAKELNSFKNVGEMVQSIEKRTGA